MVAIPAEPPIEETPAPAGGGDNVIRIIDWGQVVNNVETAWEAGFVKIGEYLGGNAGGEPGFEQSPFAVGQDFTNDVIRYEHAANLHRVLIDSQIEYLTKALAFLGNQVNDIYAAELTRDVNLLEMIAALMQGGQTGLTPATLAQIQAMIDASVAAQIVPLTENLGVINGEIADLYNQVNRVRLDPRVDGLINTVNGLNQWLASNVAPLLPFVGALAAANVLTRLADEEQCCAANSDFRNNWSDLLNKLKPLFDLLKLIDLAALLALLEHVWSEGATGFIREMLGIVEGSEQGAQDALAGFLGI